MKLLNIIYLIAIIVFIIFYFRVYEGFTDIDYGTGIGPWWAQGAGLNRGFHRCICYGTGNCNCINDNKFNKLLNTSIYPQYYFN